MPSVAKRTRTHKVAPTPVNQETAAAAVTKETTHPDEKRVYDASEAQLAAAKHAASVATFIAGEGRTNRLRSPHGHDIISQNEIRALQSAFLAASHIAYSLRRRLEQGALVEDGPFCLGRDRFYRNELGFRHEPALSGDCSSGCDGAGVIVLRHDSDLGYDGLSDEWWPIMRGRDTEPK